MFGRILLVEDEPILTAQITSTLSGLGYRVDTASDARSALRMVALHPYRLSIIGHCLSDGDGLELFRQINAIQRGATGVLLTAVANVHTIYAAMSAGMQRVLARPVDFEQLLPLLEPTPEPVREFPLEPTVESVAALSIGDVQNLLTDRDLIRLIRSIDYPFAGKKRLEYFDRDTLERVAHLVIRWCRNRLEEPSTPQQSEKPTKRLQLV